MNDVDRAAGLDAAFFISVARSEARATSVFGHSRLQRLPVVRGIAAMCAAARRRLFSEGRES
jgi:hypothetical protein